MDANLPFSSINYDFRKYAPSLRGRIVILEGLIAAGKSTAGREITKYLNDLGIKTKFFTEPLLPEFLKLFISNPKKYALAFQMTMLVKRQAIYREAKVLSDKGYCCIIDRSLHGDYCFALMHKNSGNILDEPNSSESTEWECYNEALRSEKFQHPDYVIYLKVTPEVAIQRCMIRDRSGEKAYSIQYFSQLCEIYDSVIPASPSQNMMVLDWNTPRDKDLIVKEILDAIKKSYDGM